MSRPLEGGACKWGIALFSTSGPQGNTNTAVAARPGVDFYDGKRGTQSLPGLPVFDLEVDVNG